MKIRIVIAVLGITFLNGCFYDNKEDLYKDFPQDCNTTGLTYTQDISPLISQNCLGCHSTAGGFFPVLETLQQMRANEVEVTFRITKSIGDPLVMPKGGPMQKCSVDQILTWYADGAPE
jgi:hypothetical protein